MIDSISFACTPAIYWLCVVVVPCCANEVVVRRLTPQGRCCTARCTSPTLLSHFLNLQRYCLQLLQPERPEVSLIILTHCLAQRLASTTPSRLEATSPHPTLLPLISPPRAPGSETLRLHQRRHVIAAIIIDDGCWYIKE
jgi:hypothetical protein